MKSRLINLFRNLKLLSLLSLSSCGYSSYQADDKTTISIPYIPGDREGQLTAELTRQLTTSGLYEIVSNQGDLVLAVSLVGDQNDIVGFRYDRSEESGKLEKNLMATENRRLLSAIVTVAHAGKDTPLIGPITIKGSGEYDYIDVSTLRELAFVSSSGKLEKAIDFSLGQLDSVEGAQDAVLTPAYAQLARKIVSVLQRANVESTASKDFSDDQSKR
jgi:hypothetical protein